MDEEARTPRQGGLWRSIEQGASRAILGGVDLVADGVQDARAIGSIGRTVWNTGAQAVEQGAARAIPRVLAPVADVYDWMAD